MIHVEYETPVAMRAKQEGMNEEHEVACLRLNFLWLALAYVCAHSIDKQMSMHKALDGAAPRDEVLFAKLGGEVRRHHNNE